MAKAKDGPMVVIATGEGHYGDKTRYVGERFAITDPKHFSTRWMVDPNDPKSAAEVKSLERKYGERFPAKTRDITDEQLLAEIALTQGAATALRAENIKLKEKVRELEAKIARLDTRVASPEPERAEVSSSESERADEGAEDKAGPEDGRDADDGAGDVEARPAQRRRAPR